MQMRQMEMERGRPRFRPPPFPPRRMMDPYFDLPMRDPYFRPRDDPYDRYERLPPPVHDLPPRHFPRESPPPPRVFPPEPPFRSPEPPLWEEFGRLREERRPSLRMSPPPPQPRPVSPLPRPVEENKPYDMQIILVNKAQK